MENIQDKDIENISFVRWDNEKEFQDKLLNILIEELKLYGKNDIKNFNISIGAEAEQGLYFNIGAAKKAED